MSEQILQLTAKVEIITEIMTKGTEPPNTAHNEQTESSMHGVNVDDSDDLYVQQGAKPKKTPAGIRKATSHVEGKELDEILAVQSFSEDNHNLSSDLGFNVISAKQKCLLLQLEVSSKIFEDAYSFRTALRALIIRIAGAGNIDMNKPSTITMKLVFKNDLTQDDIKVIHGISNYAISSPMIDEGPKYQSISDQKHTVSCDIAESCENCENMKSELMDQKTANDKLLSRVKKLEQENDKCVSYGIFQDNIHYSQLHENRELHDQIVQLYDKNAALISKLSKQQYVQDWVDGNKVRSISVDGYVDFCSDLHVVRNVTETDKSSSLSSGTGSMVIGCRERSGSIEAGSRRRSGSMIMGRRRRSCIF